jgi:hypothetical protein
MTSNGIFKDGLNAFQRYNINTICYRSKSGRVDGSQRNPDGLNPLVELKNNSFVGIKYLNFGKDKITDKSKLNLRLNMELVSPGTTIILRVVPKIHFNDESKWVTVSSFKLSDYLSTDGRYHEVAFPIENLDHNKALNDIGGLKGQMAILIGFNNENNGEVCRIKEYEFAKGETPTPNPMRAIYVDDKITHGRLSSVPVMARAGESVKLIVEPGKGYVLDHVSIKDHNDVPVNPNENATTLYAPRSYNFLMPDNNVVISAKFIRAE